ncbi:MAG: hypothetical protein M3040_06725, partial [Bacteroidota bacterium]|nr:hypothetical protein [Bacteroidota bacterium]
MKYSFLLLLLVFFMLNSCQKDKDRKLLGAYFKYTINGKETVINDETGINSNLFDCTFYGDTSVIINVSKIYEGAGFVVKSDSIRDATYILDNRYKVYYTNPVDEYRYYTAEIYTGTLAL